MIDALDKQYKYKVLRKYTIYLIQETIFQTCLGMSKNIFTGYRNRLNP